MTRKVRALALALPTMVAFVALASSNASAANYTASTYPTTVTGTSAFGNDTFITEGGVVECSSHFQATLTAASSSVTVTPTYKSGCWAFGFLEGSVETNGCDYLFTEPTGSGDSYSASVDLTCPAFKWIVIKAATCTVTVMPQLNLKSVALTDNTAAGDLSVKAGIKGIVYSVTQDGIGCPFNGVGTKFGGEYIQHSAITLDAVSPSTATVDVG
jgi:hypothetical protein